MTEIISTTPRTIDKLLLLQPNEINTITLEEHKLLENTLVELKNTLVELKNTPNKGLSSIQQTNNETAIANIQSLLTDIKNTESATAKYEAARITNAQTSTPNSTLCNTPQYFTDLIGNKDKAINMEKTTLNVFLNKTKMGAVTITANQKKQLLDCGDTDNPLCSSIDLIMMEKPTVTINITRDKDRHLKITYKIENIVQPGCVELLTNEQTSDIEKQKLESALNIVGIKLGGKTRRRRRTHKRKRSKKSKKTKSRK